MTIDEFFKKYEHLQLLEYEIEDINAFVTALDTYEKEKTTWNSGIMKMKLAQLIATMRTMKSCRRIAEPEYDEFWDDINEVKL